MSKFCDFIADPLDAPIVGDFVYYVHEAAVFRHRREDSFHVEILTPRGWEPWPAGWSVVTSGRLMPDFGRALGVFWRTRAAVRRAIEEGGKA